MKWSDRNSKNSLTWQARKKWIRLIWSHHREALVNDKYVRTPYWECVKGTIALIFNWEYTGEPLYQDNAIAWGDFYRYGEYDCGNGWTELTVIGWRFDLSDNGDY